MNQKGVSNIALILGVLVILAAGFGYWMWMQQSNTPNASDTSWETTQLPTPQENKNPAKPAVAKPKPTPTPVATVSLSASAASGNAPLEVLFSGSAGQGQNRLYFGDGQYTAIACLETCTKVAISQRHVYSSPGAYTAKLMRTYYPFDFETGEQKTVEEVLGTIQIRVN